MEALSGGPPQIPLPKFEPDTNKIKLKLLKNGVEPTPKIIHTLRKKEIQKHNRRAKRLAEKSPSPPLTEQQRRALAEESRFQTLRREYREFSRAVVGKPWERLEGLKPGAEFGGERLRREELEELKGMFEARRRDELRWVLDDDVEAGEEWLHGQKRRWEPPPPKRRRSEAETLRFLVDRICGTKLVRRDWKLPRMMKQSGLEFTEGQLLQIVEGLGSKGCWEQALSVVEWVYDDKEKKRNKSRFVYTKLLAILGKARRPEEALKVFNMMLGDCHIYPDMAAYHSIAVTLGQAGRLNDLIKVTECMRQKPSKRTKKMHFKNWDPVLEPDLVVYNAVLNACVPTHQWKGVSWVFKQLRGSGLKPNGATYGLAMEVMLQSGKYDLVHEYFRKMRKSGETPKALTYKVLVRALSSEGKVNEAVEAVREMEQRGVVGASSVYYELACCLCSNGRWEDAMLEVEKMKKLSNSRPLEVSFTGMITSSMQGGHIDDCISIFEHMKTHCSPNIGTINIMLKVYGRNDMFSKAKAMFEEVKKARNSNSCTSSDACATFIVPDEYTYHSMLEASASALQWEYFEHVYKEMVLSRYQLDQSKHASLLLEASRAGKWHLLEHAFDAVLNVGEIPSPLYFMEMLLQATARDDYDRTIALVNTMALAPFQISETQWKELFEKNTDIISQNHLEKLLDSLDNCDIKAEATVVNLSRALHCLCESAASLDLSTSISKWSSDANEEISEEWIDEDTDPDEDPPLYSNDVPFQVSSVVQANLGTDFRVDNKDDDTNRSSCTTRFAEDEASNDLGDPLHSKLSTNSLVENCADVDEMGLDALLNRVDDSDSDKANLPSAYQVLEAWKERRKSSGIFTFQLGQKQV